MKLQARNFGLNKWSVVSGSTAYVYATGADNRRHDMYVHIKVKYPERAYRVVRLVSLRTQSNITQCVKLILVLF